jgi:Spy/CpxP family protein refolding chaperone
MGGKGPNAAKVAGQRNAQQQRAPRKVDAQQGQGRTSAGQPKPATGQDQQRNRTALDKPQPAAQNQPPANRARPVLDRQELARQQVLRQIGLNQEQQDRMAKIRNTHDDEIVSSGRRMRQAQRGLDDAMMNPQYNPAEVNRHIEELAQAQAERVRVMQRVRAEIRQVLTPEQVMRFNQVQREMQQKQQELKRIEMLQQTSPEKSPSGDQNQSSQAPALDMVDVFIARGR